MQKVSSEQAVSSHIPRSLYPGPVNKYLSKIKRDFMEVDSTDLNNSVGHYSIPINYFGRPHSMVFAWFATHCRFDRAGACIECNFGRTHLPEKMIVDRFCKYLERFQGRPIVFVTPSGSMFDDFEVSEKSRLLIFKKVKDLGFRTVCTETRPEYLTEEKLGKVKNILGQGVELEIGFGLESSNPWILRNCINKMIDLETLIKAVELCKDSSVATYAHVLTNPPFLSEYEAIEDGVSTARWAFSKDVDRVGFAMMNIKPKTITYWLEKQGLYKTPTFWSLIKILLSFPPETQERINMFGMDSSVSIYKSMSNCPKCSGHIRSLLDAWCYVKDPSLLDEADNFPCECKEIWLSSLQPPQQSLSARVSVFYEKLAVGLYGYPWWRENATWILNELQIPI